MKYIVVPAEMLIDITQNTLDEMHLVFRYSVDGTEVIMKVANYELLFPSAMTLPLTEEDETPEVVYPYPTYEGKATTLSGYGIQDAYTKEQVDAKVASVYRVKGSVANFEALPATAVVGDVYNLTDTGANYVCIVASPAEWDKLSETVDLSHCVTSDEVSTVVSMTQTEYDTLSVKDSKTLYLIHE